MLKHNAVPFSSSVHFYVPVAFNTVVFVLSQYAETVG